MTEELVLDTPVRISPSQTKFKLNLKVLSVSRVVSKVDGVEVGRWDQSNFDDHLIFSSPPTCDHDIVPVSTILTIP